MRAYRSHRRRYDEMITKFKRLGVQQLDISDIRSLVEIQLESGFEHNHNT